MDRKYLTNFDKLSNFGVFYRYTFDKVKSVIKALRIMVGSGTNCAFFGCIQVSFLKLDLIWALF